MFYVADYDLLVLITLASALLLFSFMVGITGTILNSRPILAVYALLLWPTLISILVVGYTSYKRYAFSLDEYDARTIEQANKGFKVFCNAHARHWLLASPCTRASCC